MHNRKIEEPIPDDLQSRWIKRIMWVDRLLFVPKLFLISLTRQFSLRSIGLQIRMSLVFGYMYDMTQQDTSIGRVNPLRQMLDVGMTTAM
jgi:hypothetical protein